MNCIGGVIQDRTASMV